MVPAVPVEKPSAGAFGVYDPSAHGPRLFGGPEPGPRRVCVLCMLERERWRLGQRDAELGFVVGLLGDARDSLEPAMTERDVLAGELESGNKRISHLQVQVFKAQEAVLQYWTVVSQQQQRIAGLESDIARLQGVISRHQSQGDEMIARHQDEVTRLKVRQESTQVELVQVRASLRMLQAKHPDPSSFVSSPGMPSAALARYSSRPSHEQQRGMVIEMYMATDEPGVLRRSGAELRDDGGNDAQLTHLLRSLGVNLHASLVKNAVKDARQRGAAARCDSLPQMVCAFDADNGPLSAFLYSLVSGGYAAPCGPQDNKNADVARLKAGLRILRDHVLRLGYGKGEVPSSTGYWLARLVVMRDADRALRQLGSVGLGVHREALDAHCTEGIGEGGRDPGDLARSQHSIVRQVAGAYDLVYFAADNFDMDIKARQGGNMQMTLQEVSGIPLADIMQCTRIDPQHCQQQSIANVLPEPRVPEPADFFLDALGGYELAIFNGALRHHEQIGRDIDKMGSADIPVRPARSERAAVVEALPDRRIVAPAAPEPSTGGNDDAAGHRSLFDANNMRVLLLFMRNLADKRTCINVLDASMAARRQLRAGQLPQPPAGVSAERWFETYHCIGMLPTMLGLDGNPFYSLLEMGIPDSVFIHGGDLHFWQNWFKMIGKRFGSGLLWEVVKIWRKSKEKAAYFVYGCKDPFLSREEYLHIAAGIVEAVRRGFCLHHQRSATCAEELSAYMLACARKKPLAEQWRQLHTILLTVFMAMDCANEVNDLAHPSFRARAGNFDLHLQCQIAMLRLCACTNSPKYASMTIYQWLHMLRASPAFIEIFRNLIFTGNTEKGCNIVRDIVMERTVKLATRNTADCYTAAGEAHMRNQLLSLHSTAASESSASVRANGEHPRASPTERDKRNVLSRLLPWSEEASAVAKYLEDSGVFVLGQETVCVADPIARQRCKEEARRQKEAARRSKMGDDTAMQEVADLDEDIITDTGVLSVPDASYVWHDGTAMESAHLSAISTGCESAIISAVSRAMVGDYKSIGKFPEVNKRGECDGARELREWHLKYSKNQLLMLSLTQTCNPALFDAAEATTFSGKLTKAKRAAHAKASAEDKAGGRKGKAKLFSTQVVQKQLQLLKPELFALVGESSMLHARCAAMPMRISELTDQGEAVEALCRAREQRDQALITAGTFTAPPEPPQVTYALRQRSGDQLDGAATMMLAAERLYKRA